MWNVNQALGTNEQVWQSALGGGLTKNPIRVHPHTSPSATHVDVQGAVRGRDPPQPSCRTCKFELELECELGLELDPATTPICFI